MKKYFVLIVALTIININASSNSRMSSAQLSQYFLQVTNDNYRLFHFQEINSLECILNNGNRLVIERKNEEKGERVANAIFHASLYSSHQYCVQIGTFITIEEKKPLYTYLAKRNSEFQAQQKNN